MTAEIIRLVPRPRRDRQSDERDLFRSSERVDDLVMDHADTSPCEYSLPCLPSHAEVELD